MAFENRNASMEVQASLSPQSSPIYRGERPPPIASPDNILLYDPVEQLYHEVPAHNIHLGEVEASNVIPVELECVEEEDETEEDEEEDEQEEDEVVEEEEEDDDDVFVLAVFTPNRRKLDVVRRRLF